MLTILFIGLFLLGFIALGVEIGILQRNPRPGDGKHPAGARISL
jgi:hypothetical protein